MTATAWIESFRRKRGRPPRILHIGNIANNAYMNAKMLNEVGLDCDVLCHDYYHLMGCPEWEDADFDGEIKDQFYPDWSAVDLKGFERPDWFVQGPLKSCVRYLLAKRRGNRFRAMLRWLVLGWIRQAYCSAARRGRGYQPWKIKQLLLTLRRWVYGFAHIVFFPLRPFRLQIRGLAQRLRKQRPKEYDFRAHAEELVGIFAEVFPDRMDKLTLHDIEPYLCSVKMWYSLLQQYDLVQAYATSPILPLLAAKRPYLAFEHGTLRDFTLQDDPTHRLTSLGYHLADHVFITNGDCIEYAKKIHVTRYTPMLHPVNERRIRSMRGNYEELHREYGVRHLFLCTLRHDWKVKGTDLYIRALPRLVEFIGRDFRVLMTKWGGQVEDSLKLARDLAVGDLIVWIEPLRRARLFVIEKSVDCLFDQIALPHFGATAPEAIAAEVPVIMSYDPRSTAWIVPEPAPILTAWTAEEIVECVKKAIDPDWLENYRKRARNWIDTCHSSAIVVEKHLQVYQQVLEPNGARREGELEIA